MRKTFGMNKHQKAAHKKGERRVSKVEVQELLTMALSDETEDRLTAAENLCPCHVRTRIPAVWEALYRLMEDPDARVRQAAWHTIEDGGKPTDEAGAALLERLFKQETDPKVKRFAEQTLNKVLGPRRDKDLALLWLAGKPQVQQRGRCNFCAAQNVVVHYELNTQIPAGDSHRAALICADCAAAMQ